MDTNNENNDQKLIECLVEIYKAAQKNDVAKIKRSIDKTIKVIMEKNMVFDQHIINLMSLYMSYEKTKSQTVEEYLERRFSVFEKICKSRPADTYYLDEMKKFTEMETECYLFMKNKTPGLEKLKVEEIVKEIDNSALLYDVDGKKYDRQSSENLVSVYSALDSSMSEHSRNK